MVEIPKPSEALLPTGDSKLESVRSDTRGRIEQSMEAGVGIIEVAGAVAGGVVRLTGAVAGEAARLLVGEPLAASKRIYDGVTGPLKRDAQQKHEKDTRN